MANKEHFEIEQCLCVCGPLSVPAADSDKVLLEGDLASVPEDDIYFTEIDVAPALRLMTMRC